MKRFFVSLALVMLVVWAVRSSHPRPVHWYGPRHPHNGGSSRRELASEAQRKSQEALADARRAIHEARDEVRQAYREARDEIQQAWTEVNAEVRQAFHEAMARDGDRPPLPPVPPPAPSLVLAREEADGLPVPIVPGTRVTEAEARPPVPPVPARKLVVIHHGPTPEVENPLPAELVHPVTIKGDICATIDRAEAEGRAALRTKAAEWLEPEVPKSWTIPAPLLQSMILDTRFIPTNKPYGTIYEAELKLDLSPERRTTLVETYNRDLIRHRLASLGGALAFVLIGLGAVSGYIRADEATKGYYTRRLRMLAAAGVGAAAVVLYHMVA